MDIKRITSILLGFPFVVILLTFGNKYVVDICLAFIAMFVYCTNTHSAWIFSTASNKSNINARNSNNNVNIICTSNIYKYENKF